SWQALKDPFTLANKFTCFDDEDNDIDTAQCLHNHSVHRLIEFATIACLKTRGINKNELRLCICQNPMNAVTGCLRLPGGNADFLLDQMIQQRRLAYIRTSHDGDITGFKFSSIHDSRPQGIKI